MSQLHNIIVRPIETEKSHTAKQSGKYTFEVNDSATKKTVAQAIKKFYGVTVEKVWIIKTQAKKRMGGRRITIKRSAAKKAIVTTVGAKPIDVNKIKI